MAAGDRVDVAFTPQINEFRGARTVQLLVCDLRPAPTRMEAEQALYERLRRGESLTAQELSLIHIFIPRLQGPGGVENGNHGYPHVGKHGLPHIGHAQSTQCQHQQLYAQGKHDVLPDDGQGLAGDADGHGD